MNKKEKNIILDGYKQVLLSNSFGFDKEDTCIELKYLLDKLDLKEERTSIENEVICQCKCYNGIVKEYFQMIYDDFKKYDTFINFNIDEIEFVFEYMQYKMTEDEIKYYHIRMKNLKEKLVEHENGMTILQNKINAIIGGSQC